MTKTDYIYAYHAPLVNVDFTVQQRKGFIPHWASFTDLSTGPIAKWHWDFFCQGSCIAHESDLQNPDYYYIFPGKYDVSLTVTDFDGNEYTEVKMEYILVGSTSGAVAPPKVDFSASPDSGIAPLPVSFSYSSEERIIRCAWDFGDGLASEQESPTHTYNEPGKYTVSLTAVGEGGAATKTKNDLITVFSNDPPTADFVVAHGYPKSGPVPLTVKFINLSDGYVDTYNWEFGDGGTSSERSPIHRYTEAGIYDVKLTVSRDGMPDVVAVELALITAIDRDATVIPFFAAAPWSPTNGPPELTVDFEDKSIGQITGWAWDFGDGSLPDTARYPTHTFKYIDTYDVTLTVTDAGGKTYSSKREGYVIVHDAASYPFTAVNQRLALYEDDHIDITLSAQPSRGMNYTYELLTWPSHGSVTGTPPDLRYQPDGDFYGDDGFTFKAKSGTFESNIGSVRLTVLPVNNAPVISPMPNQAILLGEGIFDPIRLDDYVTDADNTFDEIIWEVAGDGELGIDVSFDRIVTVTPVDVNWTGTSLVSFIAKNAPTLTEPELSSNEIRVAFTVAADASELPKDSAEIQALINDAAEGDTIYIDPGVYIFSSDLSITKSLTLQADGPDNTTFLLLNYCVIAQVGAPKLGPGRLDDDDIDKVGGEVAIDGITIRGHRGQYRYGAIHNYADRLSLINCRVINNRGIIASAVYSAYRTSLYLNNTLIANNRNVEGKDIWSYEVLWDSSVHCGTIYLSGYAKLNMRNSTIAYNGSDITTVNTGYGYEGTMPVKYSAILGRYFNDVTIIGSILWHNEGGQDIAFMRETFQNMDLSWSDIQQIDVRGTSLISVDPSFDVNLEARNRACNGMGARFGSSTAIPPPLPKFIGAPRSGKEPLEVVFTDQSEGIITNWEWKFGDGKTSAERHPRHTYLYPGTFTVSLTVTGPGGKDTIIKEQYVTVATDNLGTIAGRVYDVAAPDNNFIRIGVTLKPHIYQHGSRNYRMATDENGMFVFRDVLKYVAPGETGYGETGYGEDRTYLRYKIEVSVNGYYDYVSNEEFVFAPGTNSFLHDVVLLAEVFDADFAIERGYPRMGPAPLEVKFVDRTIGNAVEWHWSFGDGTTGTGPSPTHIYNAPGSYLVTLVARSSNGVYDAEGKANYISVTVPIYASPISVLTASPVSGPPPLTVDFTDFSTGSIVAKSIDFDDESGYGGVINTGYGDVISHLIMQVSLSQAQAEAIPILSVLMSQILLLWRISRQTQDFQGQALRLLQ